MPRFPQRKFLLALGFIGWCLAGMGCASRHPSASTTVTPAEAGSPEKPKPLTRSLPAPPPELKPSTPRTFIFTPAPAPPTPPTNGWTYRKSPTTRPSLSLFEEAVLLGQVRGALKKLPEGDTVSSSKVKNRTALLRVTPKLDTTGARQIGDRLLEIPSLDEVQISPEK